MSKIDIKLSDLPGEEEGHDWAVFHNLKYKADHVGGNHTETEFEIENWSGNGLDIEVATYQTDKRKKTTLVWHAVSPRTFDGVRIKFRGSCENAEFLKMLQLILETEKMVDIIKP